MHSKYKIKGFTLIELAIVIVIVGLITGGVLGAQSLIKSSKRQALMQEKKNLLTAINAFRLEYDALPGDFEEASQYWPTDCTDGTFNVCDGDSDKIIDRNEESTRAWQHMGLAEILPRVYSGGPDNNYSTRWGIPIGPFDIASLPSSRYSDNMGWVIGYTALLASNLNNKQCLFPTNMTEYATNTYSTRYGNDTGVFTIRDVYDFDKKFDDGRASEGNIINVNWTAFTIACNAGVDYNMGVSYSDTTKGCGMCFIFE